MNLLAVAAEYNLSVLSRRTLILLVRMMEQPVVANDTISELREDICHYLTRKLVKNTADVTVYEAYGGVLGNMLLRPNWADKSPQLVLSWAKAILTFIKAHSGASAFSKLVMRYQILA